VRHTTPFQRLTPEAAPCRELSIVRSSPAIREALLLAERVAAGDAKVLITGESGVGKDLIARYIHAQSPRAAQRFVPVNCGALTESLLESELFGHARGSFTGAYSDKAGKLELANHGTIFLDEIGEMSVRMQVLLLRFLENGEIQAVGAQGPSTRVDARVIAATNRNLSELVASGAFREDLLYRIQVGHIHVPPLRHRREDIRPLIEETIARTGHNIRFSEEALAVFDSYRWPGNVRELQNVIEQLVWMSGVDVIDVQHLPPAMRTANRAALHVRERRRQLADDLYAELASGSFSFWDQVYHLFLSRDITRHDIRELVRKGLITTCGNYRALVKLFGMPDGDYKRFLNFISTHDCGVDARIYRSGKPEDPEAASRRHVASKPPRSRSGRVPPQDHGHV
jgi:transcriptional regulator with PAS, ATPase and Fis domain